MKKILCFLFLIFITNQSCFAANNAADIYLLAQTKNAIELKKIENIDTIDSVGNTALCSAINSGDVDAYNLLKEVGANPEHKCTKKISADKYQNFMQKVAVTNKQWSFLGLGKWAWGGFGAAVVVSGTVAMSGGGGSGDTDNKREPNQNQNVSCRERGYLYSYSDLCPDGWLKNSADYCNMDDGTGVWFKCDVAQTCPADYYKECGAGYDEVLGDICLSGTAVYKRCEPSTCDYKTTSCSGAYQETGNTCQSGDVVYKECEPIQCGTHGIWSEQGCVCDAGWSGRVCDVPEICPYTTVSCSYGYVATGATCQSGDKTYVQCILDSENYIEQNGQVYQKLNCVHGSQVADSCSCENGWTEYLCDTPVDCKYKTTSCTGMYQETGNTCQSGDVVYKECEPIQCGAHAAWSETKCICEPGYGNWKPGVGCHDLSNCGDHAYSDGSNCICEPGYTNWTSAGCTYRKDSRVINNTISEEDVVGLDDTQKFSIYYNAININNSTDSNVAAISIDDKELGGWPRSIEYGGTIYINNNGNGDVFGIKHTNGQGGITTNSSGFENNTSGVRETSIINIGDGDVYGVYSDIADDYTGAVGGTVNLNINYSDINHNGTNFWSSATLDIKNTGNGNIYGLWGRRLRNTNVEHYSSLDFIDYFRHIVGAINIENNGTGNVYGLYVVDGDSVYYSANAAYGVGNITIGNKGVGNSYGIFGGSVPTYNARNEFVQVNTTGNIHITNEASGSVYGMYGNEIYNAYGAGNNSAKPVESNGSIFILNNSIGNVYGMYATSESGLAVNASRNSKGSIKISNKGSGNAYGMFGARVENDNSGLMYAVGASIDLINYTDGNVYGMYSPKEATNGRQGATNSSISIQNLGVGNAYGMFANGGSITNGGVITINNIGDGVVVGMFGGEGSVIDNFGEINITHNLYVDADETLYEPAVNTNSKAFGIYAKLGSVVTNYGAINITADGAAYGIYVEGDSTVTNTGTISLNGVACSGADCNAGNYIVLNGSTLVNAGTMSADTLSLNSMGGTVRAATGSRFVATDAITGDLNISSELVSSGNQTTYVAENMIDAGDVSGLNLVSESALFNARLASNGHDVVMTMREFDEFTDNKSLAAFLAHNYATGNNTDLFGDLKSIGTNAAFMGALNGFSGLGAFNQFANEDLAAMREMNFSMNEQLFETSGHDDVDISGGVNYFSFSNQSGVGSGSYGLSIDRISDKWKMGYGISMANISTGNDDGINRQNTIGLFYMPMTYTDSGYEVIVNPKIGFSRGEYNRQGFNNMSYEGYIEKRIFGLMNDIRYPLTFGNWTVAPNLGLNAIVYNQSGHEENKMYGLIIPDSNLVSVEAGLGLYAKYDRTFADNSRLSFNIGLMAYREFGDCYNIKLGIRGMEGTFDLYDNNLYDYRGAATIGFKYNSGRLNLYGNAQYFTDSDSYMNLKAGIRFAF